MKRVLCFGDSNTYGFIPSSGKRYDKACRWTGILQTLCAEEFEIIEAGCNNRTAFSDNPAGKMQTGCKILPELLDCAPDIVILSIGINDLQKFYNPTFDEIRSGIESLIKIVRSKCPQAQILLASPSNISENILKSFFGTMFDRVSVEKSTHLRSIYEAVAQEQNCIFVDLNSVAEVSPIDGLHYNPQAHAKVAQAIYKILQNYC